MKTTSEFICQNCSASHPRWQGQCVTCNAWNSLIEEVVVKEKFSNSAVADRPKTDPIPLTEVKITNFNIIPTQIEEFDRVLGKGLVPGEIIMLSGEPGIGKSTLALQTAQVLAHQGLKVMYISGEESVSQIYLRSKRIGDNSENLLVYSEIDITKIVKTIRKYKPTLVIMDSIQVVYHKEIPSTIGSVNQVRQCASEIINVTKELNSVAMIIGHITKDGNLAGPKVLEHLVDAILYFEGERNQKYRLLRCFKNRFASTQEIGIFEMKDTGLVEVKNPSEIFIDESTLKAPGSMIVAVTEGSRVLLVEIQALVVDSGYGMAKRTFSGVDLNRANLIIATMEKNLELKLSSKDVFLNIIGGMKISEPALDLGIVLAIISSYYDKPLGQKIGVIGEVGLTGEVRAVSNIEKRINEFEKMGFTKCIIPETNRTKKAYKGKIELVYVGTILEAVKAYLGN